MTPGFKDSKPITAVLLVLLAVSLTVPVAAQDNQTTGTDHNAKHEEAIPFHLPAEVLIILGGLTSITAVAATANKYGGDIGRALYVVGSGIAFYSIYVLWHASSEVLKIAAPSHPAMVYLFLIASLLTAGGFIQTYRAI
ncbi:MAG: hypothetical protein ABEJ69_03075 [Candidatus Nanohaloarchaea archaeon]